jgi:aryl-alcohol dehydrogenase-like predicted oxidoreductase
MERRTLGTTGIEVGVVGLGAWQLGNERTWGGPGPEASLAIVDEAIALGCVLFDTAPGYAEGRSEELLGRALEGRRDRVVICSKFGHTADGRSDFGAGAIEGSVRDSLRRLRTDYLDILLLHSPPKDLMDGSAPQYAELERLRDAGLIRAYGVSLDWNDDLQRVLDATRSQVVEVLFNAFHQDPLPGIRRAGEQGVGVIVKVPLDSGWLSGKYGAGSTFTGVRDRWSPADIARRARLVEQFGALLPAGVSMAQAALRYVLAQPGVTAAIPGAKSVAQLRENVAAADGTLPANVLGQIRALWEDQVGSMPVPW